MRALNCPQLCRGAETIQDTRRTRLNSADSEQGRAFQHRPSRYLLNTEQTHTTLHIPPFFTLHTPTCIPLHTLHTTTYPIYHCIPCTPLHTTRLSIHATIPIALQLSPLYPHRHAYLRVTVTRALNVTSELSVHVDGSLPLLYLEPSRTHHQDASRHLLSSEDEVIVRCILSPNVL